MQHERITKVTTVGIDRIECRSCYSMEKAWERKPEKMARHLDTLATMILQDGGLLTPLVVKSIGEGDAQCYLAQNRDVFLLDACLLANKMDASFVDISVEVVDEFDRQSLVLAAVDRF